MRTNIEIDDQIMADAMKSLGTKTKKETVEKALKQAGRAAWVERVKSLRGMGWQGDLDEMRRDSEQLAAWSADRKSVKNAL